MGWAWLSGMRTGEWEMEWEVWSERGLGLGRQKRKTSEERKITTDKRSGLGGNEREAFIYAKARRWPPKGRTRVFITMSS